MTEWARVSKYAIQRGKQTISKNYVDGCTLYVLWHGEKCEGHFNDAQEAKEKAEALAKAEMESHVRSLERAELIAAGEA